MRRVLFGIAIGLLLSAPPVWAFRMARPPSFNEWNSNTFSALNDVLLQIFNVINGRYQLDVLTVNPNGTRKCNKGELVSALYAGADHLCQCTTTGSTWKCVATP